MTQQVRDKETGRYAHEWAYAPCQDIPGYEIAECQTCEKVRVHGNGFEKVYRSHAAAYVALNSANRAGLVSMRIARETGLPVSVYKNDEAGLDGDGYSTVCEFHHEVIQHDTLALARWHSANPLGWCEICMGNEAVS